MYLILSSSTRSFAINAFLLRVNPRLERVRYIVDSSTETPRFASRCSFNSRRKRSGVLSMSDSRYYHDQTLSTREPGVYNTAPTAQSIPFKILRGPPRKGCLTTDPVFRIFLTARRTVDGCTPISSATSDLGTR